MKELLHCHKQGSQFLGETPRTAVEYENSVGMKFRLIPPGEFLMGNTPEDLESVLDWEGPEIWREHPRESPQRTAVLTEPVYMSVTKVQTLLRNKERSRLASKFKFCNWL